MRVSFNPVSNSQSKSHNNKPAFGMAFRPAEGFEKQVANELGVEAAFGLAGATEGLKKLAEKKPKVDIIPHVVLADGYYTHGIGLTFRPLAETLPVRPQPKGFWAKVKAALTPEPGIPQVEKYVETKRLPDLTKNGFRIARKPITRTLLREAVLGKKQFLEENGGAEKALRDAIHAPVQEVAEAK